MHLLALQPFRSGFPDDSHTQFLDLCLSIKHGVAIATMEFDVGNHSLSGYFIIKCCNPC